jgi:hypothetical protein
MADEQNKSNSGGGSTGTGGAGGKKTGGEVISGQQIFAPGSTDEATSAQGGQKSGQQSAQGAGQATGGGNAGGGQPQPVSVLPEGTDVEDIGVGGKVEAEQNPVAEITTKITDAVSSGDTGAIKSAAKDAFTQATETAGKAASGALGQVKEQATSKIDETKGNLAQSLGSVADGLRKMGDTLNESEASGSIVNLTSRYGGALADQIEDLSGYLEGRDVGTLVRDVEGFARRNPGLFIGAAFAIGMLGARFLKSSKSNQALIPIPRNRALAKTTKTTKTSEAKNETGEGVHPV